MIPNALFRQFAYDSMIMEKEFGYNYGPIPPTLLCVKEYPPNPDYGKGYTTTDSIYAARENLTQAETFCGMDRCANPRSLGGTKEAVWSIIDHAKSVPIVDDGLLTNKQNSILIDGEWTNRNKMEAYVNSVVPDQWRISREAFNKYIEVTSSKRYDGHLIIKNRDTDQNRARDIRARQAMQAPGDRVRFLLLTPIFLPGGKTDSDYKYKRILYKPLKESHITFAMGEYFDKYHLNNIEFKSTFDQLIALYIFQCVFTIPSVVNVAFFDTVLQFASSTPGGEYSTIKQLFDTGMLQAGYWGAKDSLNNAGKLDAMYNLHTIIYNTIPEAKKDSAFLSQLYLNVVKAFSDYGDNSSSSVLNEHLKDRGQHPLSYLESLKTFMNDRKGITTGYDPKLLDLKI